MRGYWRIILVGALLVLCGAGYVAMRAWKAIYGPATTFDGGYRMLYVPTGAGLEQVMDSLDAIGALRNERDFQLLAARKNYGARVRPGRYRIDAGMSLNALIDRLRSGEQDPVRVTFNNIDRLEVLAGRLARQLEPDSIAFVSVFRDPAVHSAAGLSEATFSSLFIPNTYELWWTTTPEQFVARMQREQAVFWNDDRKARARAIGLEPVEVGTLASIVHAETGRMDDAAKIAGVYLNRLRIGMPLQADPTLKFALGIDSVSRVLDSDKLVDSPYNTYTHRGLPPGPIRLPDPRYIDAVLEPARHDYLYFCARADLSGHSEFARTYEQHLVNARKYQRALNERRIYR